MMKTFKQFILESPAVMEQPANIDELLADVDAATKDPIQHREAIPGLLDGIKQHIDKLQKSPDPGLQEPRGADKLGAHRIDYQKQLQKLTAKWITLNRTYNAHNAMEESDSEQLNYETAYLVKETRKLLMDCQANGLFSSNRPSRRRRR